MRHQALILEINRRIASSLPYEGRVVDLGCGACPYRAEILRKATEYVGVDWENSAHDTRNVDVFADLSRRLPFDDRYADTVVSFQVIEHLPEPGSFLSECHRILVPGGRLFLTVPFMWGVHEAPRDYYRFTRHGLEYLLGKSGFVDVEIRENTGYWQTSVLKFAYHTVRFAHGPLRFAWAPVWWVGHAIAPVLDRIDPSPCETASYTALARKPAISGRGDTELR